MRKSLSFYRPLLQLLLNTQPFFEQTDTALFKDWVETCDRGFYTQKLMNIFIAIAEEHLITEKFFVQNLLLELLKSEKTPENLYSQLKHHPEADLLFRLMDELNEETNFHALKRAQIQFGQFTRGQIGLNDRLAKMRSEASSSPLSTALAFSGKPTIQQAETSIPPLPSIFQPTKITTIETQEKPSVTAKYTCTELPPPQQAQKTPSRRHSISGVSQLPPLPSSCTESPKSARKVEVRRRHSIPSIQFPPLRSSESPRDLLSQEAQKQSEDAEFLRKTQTWLKKTVCTQRSASLASSSPTHTCKLTR